MGLEDGIGLLGQVRVLDPRRRKALRDHAVEPWVARLVDDRALVGALEVDGVDRTGRAELADERLVPFARRVELEAEGRVALQQERHRVGGGRPLDPQGDDEVDRPRLAADGLAQREARLPEREVERRALVGPAPVVGEGGHPGALGEERQALEELEKLSSVWLPASGSVGPSAWSAFWSSLEYVTSSPTPSWPPPSRWITVVRRVKSCDACTCRPSNR